MDCMDLTIATISDLRALQSRDVTAEEITQAYLSEIARHDGKVRSFVDIYGPSALEQARAVDAKRRRGEPLGPLAGIPLAIKDNLCHRGWRTTCASRMLANFVPTYSAHAIERLVAADAILVGTTNMDEFAMGSSTENSAWSPTRNPWDLSRTPGGSSGGSAAAVASGMVPAALGSDTGGSVRQPAAFCGIVGMKPSYGRVSRYGLVAFASSLDQVGPMGRCVSDCAELLQVIAGYDPRDSTSVDLPVPSFIEELARPPHGLVVGVPREHFAKGLDEEVEQAIRNALRALEGAGAVIREISLPHTQDAVAVYYLIATAEASSNLARYDGMHFGHRASRSGDLTATYCQSRGEGFGPEVKRRIMLGTYVLSSGYRDAYYVRALRVRRLIKEDFDRAFRECHVIVGPTTPTAAFRLGEKSNNPLEMYLSDVYTISANLAGIPALSLPCGWTQGGLPIGLQVQAPVFADGFLLRVARWIEQVLHLPSRRPVFSA
jgi:aspartyl-tRNA(Asn)/glutamyl-tRNA(Gln) amidotransferase subunit A